LEWGDHCGYTIRSIKENGPLTQKYSQFSDNRNKYKNWFKENIQLINDVFNFWYNDNKALADKFVEEFVTTYNWVANKSFVPKITITTTGGSE